AKPLIPSGPPGLHERRRGGDHTTHPVLLSRSPLRSSRLCGSLSSNQCPASSSPPAPNSSLPEDAHLRAILYFQYFSPWPLRCLSRGVPSNSESNVAAR